MPDSSVTLDLDAIVARSRSLRHDALNQSTETHLELYAKVAIRSKIVRGPAQDGVTSHLVHESGIAVRVMSASRDRVGFAASSGLSPQIARWAASTAARSLVGAPGSVPRSGVDFESERWDLDAPSSLPGREELDTALLQRPWVQWVEAGITVEVILGAEGWLAVRRRDRLWALGGGPEPMLSAQRGFLGWERLLDRLNTPESTIHTQDQRALDVLVLAPDAASPVATALVDRFHGPHALPGAPCGGGWDVIDDPGRRDGLAGGSFDDVGFPTSQRVLAKEGVWMGRLGGPGSFHRSSFREPPRESPTNLVMRPGESEAAPEGAKIARRCRVLKLSTEIWVLELESGGFGGSTGLGRTFLKVRPTTLLAVCSSRLGGQIVTAGGAIVPCVVFEGISAP
jgi:hypothetical protein